MSSAHDVPESGTLPSRIEWIEEPDGPLSVPENPDWNLFSDNMRGWTATPGVQAERNDGLGTADAVDHSRGTAEPEATIAYDLDRFPVDGSGNPQGAEAYGILRDEYNQLHSTLLCVSRSEVPGGDHGAGIRMYTVVQGTAFANVEATLDPTENDPILMELEAEPARVSSYAIHQPDESATVEVTSTEASADGDIDVTIEDEDAETSETIKVGGETTAGFEDIDVVWLDDEPEGDITVSDGTGKVFAEFGGGLTHSDDDQPVDGEQGIPPLGDGSHADPIDGTSEHFIGDRLERPAGTPLRPRINSASWSIENTIEREGLHTTRAPTVDVGNRLVQVEADVGGPTASHDSMMEAVRKTANDIEHELSGGVITFEDCIVVESIERELEADDQAAAQGTETFEASGGTISLSAN